MKKILFLLILGLLLQYGQSTAETNDLGSIRAAIENSALPGEKKSLLFNQASGAVSAGIPADDVAVIIKRGLSRNTDSKALEEALGAAVTAQKKGLPVRPVLDRIEQGLSKGVPAGRISAATIQLVAKLSSADALVNYLGRNGLNAGEQKEKGTAVHTVARALERSIPEESIRTVGHKTITQGSTLSSFAANVDTLAFFVESGMALDQAAGLIHKAIDKGYSENEMFMMQREMSQMMRGKSNMNNIMKNMDMMMNSGAIGRGMGGGPYSPNNPGGMGSSGMGGASSSPNNPGMRPHGMGGGSGMGGPRHGR